MRKLRQLTLLCATLLVAISCNQNLNSSQKRSYNSPYEGEDLNRIAFPIGGMGTGMFCIEGTGAISHMSVWHNPQMFNEPAMFAAVHVKGAENGSLVLEGQVPERKKYGSAWANNGGAGATWGLPRYENCTFSTEFPFADIKLTDKNTPLNVDIKAWNPFVPTDENSSSLPVAGFEYTFTNTSSKAVEAIFSYNSRDFMNTSEDATSRVKPIQNGFILSQEGTKQERHLQGDFAIFTDEPATVNGYWFRGGWWDALTMAWNNVERGTIVENAPLQNEQAPGASLYVPFTVEPGASKTIRLYMAWYVPVSNIVFDDQPKTTGDKGAADCDPSSGCCPTPATYEPWYSRQFKNVKEVASFWASNYNTLRDKTNTFTETFYNSSLAPEVIEAVAANLSILKSPTVLRQHDGRLWNYEGCSDNNGCCHGSCTHVWNYAQAIAHLFPRMERTLRESEFLVSQNQTGHQIFRTNLPIQSAPHDFHAAADGQLGGIVKVYRDWRISGDNAWLKNIYPQVKSSIDYCITTWDPRRTGVLEEPHHNTYDIEFWGPNGMCSSFYAAALEAMILLGEQNGDDVSSYKDLLAKNRTYMEEKLYNGEYFFQEIRWEGLNAPNPTEFKSMMTEYSPEAMAILKVEGPKYQYGTGCLSDGIIGYWMALTAGIEEPIDKEKAKSHLNAIHKYNLKKDLRNHPNPQRPTFAFGNDGGLLLCTWPKGGKLQLPFVYSDEVWTGIEYQVASHLIFEGEVEKGLEIVRTCRDRYDGAKRNPYDEYECGSWYGRAMASYSLLQALTGVRYDAIDKTLYIDSKVGDFTSFLSTETGFGNVSMKNGQPEIDVTYGQIDIKKCIVASEDKEFKIL